MVFRSIALLNHLAELHLGEGLEQYADEVHMRALIMQSSLDNTAIAISHIKNIAHARLAQFGEEFQEDQEPDQFFRKSDALIMQVRSAKVVASKAIRQLDELKATSLTLDPSTSSTIEQTQHSTSDLAAITLKTCSSLFKQLQEGDDNAALTYEDVSRFISSSEAKFFSPLSQPIHLVTTQLQVFFNLTNNLTQTVEFYSPAPPPPWQLLAQEMRTATAMSATHEVEVGRLKDEMAEKNTALARREKEVEEMSVQVEVLAKRVGESGGWREKVRELESAVETTRVKEQDLLSHLAHLQRDLRALESEREVWKKTPEHQTMPVDLSNPSAANSPSSLRQMHVLKSEIAALQSSVRYLRDASHNHHLSGSLSFLSVPLVAPPPPTRTSLQSEAADVFRELLRLTTRLENQIVRLKPVPPEERLKWRPMRETSKWMTGRQREDWQAWKEWRDGVTGKATRDGNVGAGGRGAEERRMKLARTEVQEEERSPVVAWVETKVKAGAGRDVRVVSPAEWDDVGRVLGINSLGHSTPG